MMTTQERKDFRRVQKSRDMWKHRAVGRGEDSRRLRDRRKEVEGSRAVWRARALAAEARSQQLAIETDQRHSALMHVPQGSPLATTPFF